VTAEPLTGEKIRKTLLEVIRARAAADQRPLSDGMLEEANPYGYLEHLRTKAKLDPVTASYIREALGTSCWDCHYLGCVINLGCGIPLVAAKPLSARKPVRER
jgi:hypothetical protein